MKTQIDPIRIDHTGIYLGDKAIPGVIRWTARHEPDRGVFELQLTIVTDSCHVSLDAPAGQLLGGPVGSQARAGSYNAGSKDRGVGRYNAETTSMAQDLSPVTVSITIDEGNGKTCTLTYRDAHLELSATPAKARGAADRVQVNVAGRLVRDVMEDAAPAPHDAAEPAGGAK